MKKQITSLTVEQKNQNERSKKHEYRNEGKRNISSNNRSNKLFTELLYGTCSDINTTYAS